MTTNHPHYFHPAWIVPTDRRITADLCVYGGTAGGVVAALKAQRLGLTVCLLHPGTTLGGMTTGGLGWSDIGQPESLGGMAKAFYTEIANRRGEPGQSYRFTPTEAQVVIDDWVRDADLDWHPCQFLDAAVVEDHRITEVIMLGGLRVRAKAFIDATYEGDLFGAAGVSYRLGREPNAAFNETLNGTQVHHKHQFRPASISPFVTPDDPSSGLLPGIEPGDAHHRIGLGDTRIQAYNFRVCLTNDPELRLDWQRPEDYNPLDFELALRWYEQPDKHRESDSLRKGLSGDAVREVPWKYDVLPVPTPNGHRKTDTNNHGPVSSDLVGGSQHWPTADHATREKIFQAHVTWQQGLYWTLANDPRVPDLYRNAYGKWGLPRDEFTDTGHWPHQLYVREGRRLVGMTTVTEHHCLGIETADDPVAMASYQMDSHNCSRFIATADDGRPVVMNEGDVQTPATGPYAIPLGAMIPGDGHVTNLIVSACISATHIAYGSIRMEPIFMALGESAACAATVMLRDDHPAQNLNYRKLRPLLDDSQQVVAAHAY
ncbi:MAG: FAD-dependent oxidoreductase [Planctomycetota bacterium]